MALDSKERSLIVEKAKELLQAGNEKASLFSNPVRKESAKYGKAQDYLVAKAIEEFGDSELESQFDEIVPVNNVLKERLKHELKDIFSTKDEIRLKASKIIDSQSRAVPYDERMLWLRHPTTVRLLREALSKEQDERVQENLVRALGSIYSRIVKDPRIFDSVKRFLESKNSKVRLAAVIWTGSMCFDEKWPHVISIAQSTGKYDDIRGCLWQMACLRTASKSVIISFYDAILTFTNKKRLPDHKLREILDSLWTTKDDNLISILCELYQKHRTIDTDRAMQQLLTRTNFSPAVINFFSELFEGD
ncbi:MAG: HEAT repeat domain-containing protein [Pirellulaceae bacterium]